MKLIILVCLILWFSLGLTAQTIVVGHVTAEVVESINVISDLKTNLEISTETYKMTLGTVKISSTNMYDIIVVQSINNDIIVVASDTTINSGKFIKLEVNLKVNKANESINTYTINTIYN